jgi:Ca2+-binding RTX toxin-like protein
VNRIAGVALTAALAAFALPGPAVADGAGKPMCLGQRATLVVHGTDGYGRGTGRDDVIVVTGLVLAIEARGGDDLICNRGGGPATILDGGAGDDRIDAGDGGGFLSGGRGADEILAGTGDDYIYDGRGSDVYHGGNGDDAVFYDSARGPIRASLATKAASTAADFDRLIGIETLGGSRFADILVGADGGNLLSGGPGDDTLLGLAGHDALIGGAGRDSAEGGAARDRCDAERMSSCERRFPPLHGPIGPDD